MGSEDVGLFTLDGKIPGVMYWLGAADPAKLAESRKTGVPLPSLHSALFAPVLRAGHHYRRDGDDGDGARPADNEDLLATSSGSTSAW